MLRSACFPPSRHIITPAIYLIILLNHSAHIVNNTIVTTGLLHAPTPQLVSSSSPTTSSSLLRFTSDTMAPATASTRPDIIVVGAGIVGSALAYSLGKSGRKVALFERDFDEPDRIVGELLQPGGVRALAKMGIVDTLQDIDAVPVEGYHVFYGPRSVPIPYPNEKPDEAGRGVVSASGKVEGRSFHHGKFVQSLRNKALNQSTSRPTRPPCATPSRMLAEP